MSYRPEWAERILNGRSILQCALDVHMTNTGSGERSNEEQENDVKVLSECILNWNSSIKFTYHFDRCVYDLIYAALAEVSIVNSGLYE